MSVLVMGEESQEICKAMRERGHAAFSCDLQGCSGGQPEWHIKGDMFDAFWSDFWDMIIVHPVCTFMCNSGALRLYKNGKKENGIDPIGWANMEKSAKQFKQILDLPCDKIAVENPVMHSHAKSIIGIDQSQSIQPYEYGHPESKRTCLWLKGLPLLMPTDALKKPECGYWDNQTPSGQNKMGGGMGKERSKTYSGIAKAMAQQWG